VIEFFIGLSMASPLPPTLTDLIRAALITQLVVVATPPLLMAVMLTRRPLTTLLLRGLSRKVLAAIPLAILLAAALQPLVLLFARGLTELYPMRGGDENLLKPLTDAPIALRVALFALLPALCEEIAFRGFILSGLRRLGHRWRAILISAVFFGIAHQILQQSIITAAVGVVLGFLAVQTGSLWPCIAFHATHNSLMLLVHDAGFQQQFPMFDTLIEEPDASGMILYRPGVLIVSLFVAVLLLLYFARLKTPRSPEEQLEEAIDRADRGQQRHDDGPIDGAKNSNGMDQHRHQATTA
jgi:sodium transport system permease protein